MSEKTSLYVRSISVIVGICLIVGLMLAGIYKLTAPRIEANELKKQQKALYELFPEASGFDDLTNEDLPQTVTSLFKTKEGDGFVAYLQTSTQYGTSSFAVGIDAATLKITEMKEITYGDSIHFGEDYLPSFAGKTEDDLADIASSASPAKITRSAVKNAVGDLLLYLEDIAKDPNEPTPDPEELAQLFPNASGFTKVEEGTKPATLTELYKTNEGDGYVAFIATTTQWGSGASSSFAIAIDAQTQTIIETLVIRYSDSDTGANGAPLREPFMEFLASFEGKGASDIDLISGASPTKDTKAAFKAAVTEMFTYLESLGGNN